MHNLESILISIVLGKSQPILFLNWYRPPNSHRDILTAYENLLLFITKFNFPAIIMGDSNFDILRKPLISQTKMYNQVNSINGFHYANVSKRNCNSDKSYAYQQT